jgi:hypothetical protein
MSGLEQVPGWIPIVGSAVGAIITVGTLISKKLSGMEERHNKELLELMEKFHGLDKRLTINETYNNIFWKDYKQEAAKVITQPHTPEIDMYMRLMREREEQDKDLTLKEKRDLVQLLQDTVDRNYDVPAYIEPNMATYIALLSRFRSEIRMESIIKDIEKKYGEQVDDLRRKYEEKKKENRSKWWFSKS